MESQNYSNNRDYIMHRIMSMQEDNTVPLKINCTGYEKFSTPFVTNGARLDWYLLLMDEGTIKSQHGDISKAQFILWPPNSNHHYELDENKAISYYWVHFTGNFAEELLKINGIEHSKIYTISDDLLNTMRREWWFLFREYMLRRPGYETMVASLLMSLIVRLGREIKKNSPEAVGGDLRKRLEYTVSYIHNHYTENIQINILSEMEHLSESRFRELFKNAFGVSPGEYIINLRIERAGELLLTTDSSVSSIAQSCGYGDELYFSRLFKKKTGMSPLRYRREYLPSVKRTHLE